MLCQEVNLEIREKEGLMIVTLTDPQGKMLKLIEEETIRNLRADLFSLIEDGDPPWKILLDFHKVDFLSASAMGVFIRFNVHAEKSGIKIAFYGMKPEVYRVFKITKLDEHFNIIQSLNGVLEFIGFFSDPSILDH
jgi:anti-sigma B factor antagonist